MHIKTIVDDNIKTISIWLTNKEQTDSTIQNMLTSIYKHYKDKKYTVAVFRSGNADLKTLTSDLLCYNRKKVAQIEAK